MDLRNAIYTQLASLQATLNKLSDVWIDLPEGVEIASAGFISAYASGAINFPYSADYPAIINAFGPDGWTRKKPILFMSKWDYAKTLPNGVQIILECAEEIAQPLGEGSSVDMSGKEFA